MEFDTTTRFEALVDKSSLKSAREEVEDQLGDIEVQVAAQVGSGGSAGGGRSPVVTEFEEEHRLSQTRNSLLRDLVDAQEQDSYNRAASVGGGLGGAALAGVIGLGAAGLSALSNFSWPDLPKLELPDIPPVPIKDPSPSPIPVEDPSPVPAPEPDWSPLDVPKPDWLPLTDPTGGGSGSDDGTGTTEPVPDDIQQPGPAGEPSAPPASDDSPGGQPAPLPDGIQDPGPVPGFGDAPVPAPAPGNPSGTGPTRGPLGDVGIGEVAGGLAVGSAGAALGKFLQGAGKTAGGAASSVAALPSYIAAQAGQNSQTRPEDKQTWFDKLVGNALDSVDLGGGSSAGAAMILPVRPSTDNSSQSHDPGRERLSRPTKVEHSPTYNIQNLDELERQQRQARRDIEKRIENLERALSRR